MIAAAHTRVRALKLPILTPPLTGHSDPVQPSVEVVVARGAPAVVVSKPLDWGRTVAVSTRVVSAPAGEVPAGTVSTGTVSVGAV